jgi:hypothetical protein
MQKISLSLVLLQKGAPPQKQVHGSPLPQSGVTVRQLGGGLPPGNGVPTHGCTQT